METYIGNYVVWKHHLHLETWIGYWKQKLDIGNIHRILETKIGYWKHTYYIGNIGLYIGNIVIWKHHLHFETWIRYWKQKLDIGNMKRRLET